MARTMMQIPFSGSVEEAQRLVWDFLPAHGFHPYPKYGEGVWKKGTGVATAMQYMELEFCPGVLNLSAWVQAGLGSANLGNEMDLEGVVAIVPKKSLKKVLEALKRLLSTSLPSGNVVSPAPAPAASATYAAPQPSPAPTPTYAAPSPAPAPAPTYAAPSPAPAPAPTYAAPSPAPAPSSGNPWKRPGDL